ncbi:MAG: hypothetical protein Q4E65_07870 [Clostridia bacterium]|nr:hypothetical protein [Clostridia bacterium]
MKTRMTCLLACIMAALFLAACQSHAPKAVPVQSVENAAPVTATACPAVETCATGKMVVSGLVIVEPTLQEAPAAQKAGREAVACCPMPDPS